MAGSHFFRFANSVLVKKRLALPEFKEQKEMPLFRLRIKDDSGKPYAGRFPAFVPIDYRGRISEVHELAGMINTISGYKLIEFLSITEPQQIWGEIQYRIYIYGQEHYDLVQQTFEFLHSHDTSQLCSFVKDRLSEIDPENLPPQSKGLVRLIPEEFEEILLKRDRELAAQASKKQRYVVKFILELIPGIDDAPSLETVMTRPEILPGAPDGIVTNKALLAPYQSEDKNACFEYYLECGEMDWRDINRAFDIFDLRYAPDIPAEVISSPGNPLIAQFVKALQKARMKPLGFWQPNKEEKEQKEVPPQPLTPLSPGIGLPTP